MVAVAEPRNRVSAGPAAGPTQISTPAGGHLWQVDVVRLLAFGAVIWVHVLAFTQQPDDEVAAGAMMLLQFGREVFFALTGFVLVFSARRRPSLPPVPFWRKRVLCVAVPYVVWSAVYYAYSVLGHQHLRPSLSGFALDLFDGGAMYHLYFLLVTLQMYLVFPWLLRFVRRTSSAAGRILIAVTVVNLAWMAVLQWVPAPTTGTGRWLFDHAYELLPTYAMYVLAGCYGAIHVASLQAFARRHRVALGVAAAAATIGALGVYIAQIGWMAPRFANSVLQPAMALTCIAAVIVLWAAGERWVARGRRGQGQVEALSDASFGVYLSHPVFLALLLDYARFGNGNQVLPAPVATVLAFVGATGAAAVLSLAARRTPLSLALAGRPRERRRVQLAGVQG